MARALLVVFSNPTSDDVESEFNDWYSDAHLQDVVAIPGITAAQRFRLVNLEVSQDVPFPDHRYLAIYEADYENLEEVTKELQERGGTEAMPNSTAIDLPGVRCFWWEPIGERVVSGD